MAIDLEEPKTHQKAEVNTGDGCLRAGIKEAAEQIEETISTSKAKVVETLKDGKRSAERLLRQGRNAVEDGIEEGSHRIKRNPLGYVAAALAAGTIAGIVIGLLIPRGDGKAS